MISPKAPMDQRLSMYITNFLIHDVEYLHFRPHDSTGRQSWAKTNYLQV